MTLTGTNIDDMAAQFVSDDLLQRTFASFCIGFVHVCV